jgi:SAM-dependent methyltransferase
MKHHATSIDRESMNSPDWSRTSADYATHRKGFPPHFWGRLSALGVAAPGQRVVDLGTGAGTVALGLTEWGADVTGLDIAPGQIDAARRAARARGLDVDFRVGAAENTGLTATSFDAVVAGQCWHWFDRRAAAAESWRLLRPGGRVVIAHFDWLDRPGNVVRATLEVAGRHRRSTDDITEYSVDAFYPRWLDDVREAGFSDIETFSFDVDASYTHAGWRGRMRASAWIGASLTTDQVQRFDHDLASALDAWPDPMHVPHRVFVVHATKPHVI